MKVLVTGATGFLGRSFVPRLVGAGHEVAALVRPGPERRLEGLGPGVERVVHDLTRGLDPGAFPGGVDAVVHLAQSSHRDPFPDGAADVFALNCSATLALVEWARGTGARRFVLASTGSIYRLSPAPIAEDGAIEPRDFYGLSKRIGEDVAFSWSGHLEVAAARLFCVYGPAQVDRLVPRLVERVRSGTPVELAGAEGLRLNPIHVDEAAEAMLRLLESSFTGPLNVGGDRGWSIREMALAIGRALETSVRFVQRDALDAGGLVGDVGRLSRELGFTAKIGFEEGIRGVLAAKVG